MSPGVATRSGLPGRDGRAPVEWQTLLLIACTYGGWLAITHAYGRWPLAIVAPVAVVLVVLQSSLQHEILHGHPTRWVWLNHLLAVMPLALWLPYERYRQRHLTHHRDERLTDPLDDPETAYLTPERWAHMSAPVRAIVRLQQPLLGRLLLGPPWRIAMFLRVEFGYVVRNDYHARRVWLEHLAWCVLVVLWVTRVCGMPLWLYLAVIVLPSYAVLLTRSFAEHRAHPDVRHRIAIVERSWILGPLFLFNNLHSLHHEAPTIPWYEYNARYRLIRERLIAENGGLVYSTYFDVARRFLFRAHDVLVHPTGRVP